MLQANMGSISGQTGSDIVVPVNLTNTLANGINKCEFDVKYDATKLTYISAEAGDAVDYAACFSASNTLADEIKLSYSDVSETKSQPITKAGKFANLTFRINGNAVEGNSSMTIINPINLLDGNAKEFLLDVSSGAGTIAIIKDVTAPLLSVVNTTVSMGKNIMINTNESATVYLVPSNTIKTLDAILAGQVRKIITKPNVDTAIDTIGLDVKNTYIAYAIDNTGNISEATGKISITVDECFIATAAYGSKFMPAVTLLRSFRDDFLLTNPVGQAFVKFYYKNSPPIANFIAGNSSLRAAVRALLTPLILIAYSLYHPMMALLLFMIIVLTVRKKQLVKQEL
jgi:hypothetical protein